MNPQTRPLSAADRDTLAYTADTLALLQVPGCTEFANRLSCIAQTNRPAPALLDATLRQAPAVKQALLVEASPDRWADDVTGFDPATANEIISDLIAQRRHQAAQVTQAAEILIRLHTPANTIA